MSSRLAWRTVRSLRSICSRSWPSWRYGRPASFSSSLSSRPAAVRVRRASPAGGVTDLDAPADLHLLGGRQQRDLSDLLEVETDGILAARRRTGFEWLGPRGLLGFLLEGARRLGLVGGDERAWSHGCCSRACIASTFPECHPVTNSPSGVTVYDAKFAGGVSGRTLKVPEAFPGEGSPHAVYVSDRAVGLIYSGPARLGPGRLASMSPAKDGPRDRPGGGDPATMKTPSASYSFTIRLQIANRPGMLGRVP